MHLLLISRCPPYPLYLGDRLILYYLARELSQRGHTLDLLAFDDRLDIPDERAAYAGYFRHIEILPAPRRGMVNYLKRLLLSQTRFPTHEADSSSPVMWAAIQRQLQQNSYDAAHFFGGVQVYEYRHAVEHLPTIITPYESYNLYLRRMIENAGAGFSAIPKRLALLSQRFIVRAFERFMFAPFARTVVVSQRDADELHALNPALNISVIPNGVDVTPLLPDSTREAATLLFTGNYEYPPNVDAALYLATKVLPQVRQQIPDAKLWLVGNAPPPQLLALANEHVMVIGHVPDLTPYLEQATGFVSPLRLGAGIKNKVLQALALGCPVVATPLSVDGIDVQHGRDALITELDDLPNAVIRLLRDPQLQQVLSMNGRQVIEANYTWSRVADLYEAVYQTVIKD